MKPDDCEFVFEAVEILRGHDVGGEICTRWYCNVHRADGSQIIVHDAPYRREAIIGALELGIPIYDRSCPS
ncbi:hypothetical protein HY78_18690 [Rhizorhabdus wittichii DC-6]|nr:hypothetical protein HY78_18690 [Rhizorhabdus wittichii DC-6]